MAKPSEEPIMESTGTIRELTDRLRALEKRVRSLEEGAHEASVTGQEVPPVEDPDAVPAKHAKRDRKPRRVAETSREEAGAVIGSKRARKKQAKAALRASGEASMAESGGRQAPRPRRLRAKKQKPRSRAAERNPRA